MNVEPANIGDLPAIQEAYAEGRSRQKERGTLVWPEFSEAALLAELRAQRPFRVMNNEEMAGTFAIAYEDRAVWGDRERGAHVYLHRIARSPSAASPGFLRTVVDWACSHSGELGREGIRMDTAAKSERLIAYYERAGFVVVGRHVIGPDPTLPSHYHGTEVALFELICPKRSAHPPTAVSRNADGPR